MTAEFVLKVLFRFVGCGLHAVNSSAVISASTRSVRCDISTHHNSPLNSQQRKLMRDKTWLTRTKHDSSRRGMNQTHLGRARKSTRRILPLIVFGNSGRNSISRGYLYGAVTL